MKKPPEILSPAGDLQKLKFAAAFGADAVYLSGKNFGLRNFSGNFDDAGLKEAVSFTHSKNVKAYVTVNIFPHNADIPGIKEFLRYISEIKADAAIVTDLGVFGMAKQAAPSLPLHVSVQANNTNYASVNEWKEMGAKRVVLARELTIGEIKEIRQKVPGIELEVFVHGAVCMSYSGRCLLSDYMAGRSANKGECAQSCRWSYKLVEEKRPGEYIDIDEDSRGTYIMNAKDLNTVNRLADFIEAGVDSFKIEGRMKSAYYAAVTAACYKAARDGFWAKGRGYTPGARIGSELENISHRQYTEGFYFAERGKEPMQNPATSEYIELKRFAGYVIRKEKDGALLIDVKNSFRTGETLNIFNKDASSQDCWVRKIVNTEGVEELYAKQDSQYTVYFDKIPQEVSEYSIIRK